MDAAFSLDLPTLVLARVVSIVVFAIAVPIMTLRKGRPETAVFCWSLAMAIVTWVALIAAVGTDNMLITAIFAGCITSTVSLQWAAIVVLSGQRLHPAWFVAPPVVASVSVLAFDLDAGGATLLGGIVLSIQLAAAMTFVAVYSTRVVRKSTAVLMAMGYGISFCSAVVRPFEQLVLGRGMHEPLSSGFENTLPFIGSYVGTTLIILSWLAALKDRAEASLADMAFRDELTGLANRRAMLEQGRKLWTKSRWEGTSFTLVVIDLDNFKRINDQWGHDVGDKVLAAFGAVSRTSAPPPAIAARMGGEEFCLIYVGVDARTAHDFSERLREAFAEHMSLPDGTPVRFSAGIAQSGPSDNGVSSLYRRADDALYQAKASGRDCAIISVPLAA